MSRFWSPLVRPPEQFLTPHFFYIVLEATASQSTTCNVVGVKRGHAPCLVFCFNKSFIMAVRFYGLDVIAT